MSALDIVEFYKGLKIFNVPIGGSGIGGGFSGLGEWNYIQAVAVPAAGEFRFDNIDPTLATEFRINKTNNKAQDMSAELELVAIGNYFYMQNPLDADESFSLLVSSVTDNGTYITFGFAQYIAGAIALVDTTEFAVSASILAPTGDQIVNLVNQGLGNVWWQQGISNVVWVRDLGQNSVDLAPYLNGGTGEWDFPGGTVLIIDTDQQTPESLIGRNLNALGDLVILPSVIGGVKGMTMTNGYGVGTVGVKMNSSSNLVFGDVRIISDDVTRQFFDVQFAANFIINSLAMFIVKPGRINASSIRFNVELVGLFESAIVIGEDNTLIVSRNVEYAGAFLANISDVFDNYTEAPLNPRAFNFQNQICGLNNAGNAVIAIDQDDGDFIGEFSNCYDDPSLTGIWMRATADAAFNANPAQSLNFSFDVQNFAITQRLAEIYVEDNQTTLFSAANTPTDLIANFVLGDDSSGFSMPSEGVLQYELNEKIVFDVTFQMTGNKLGGGTIDYEVHPQFKPSGGVFADITKTDGVDIVDLNDSVSASPGDFVKLQYQFSITFENQGDQLKNQIVNLVNTNGWVANRIFWLVKKVA